MYKVEKGRVGEYEVFILIDESSGARVKVVPERGGIVTGFEVDNNEIFYMDNLTLNDSKKNVRGGNPVLFPICGGLENGSYNHEGKSYNMGNHGLVRNFPWQVTDIKEEECAEIILSIKSNEEMKKKYPFDFEVIFKYSLKGNTLSIKQEYINKGPNQMPMYAGFHPYFNISDKNSLEYGIDAETFMDADSKNIEKYQGNIELKGEDVCKIILDAKGNSVYLYDRNFKRKISMEYSSEFKYIVLWTVEGKDFLCLEPWMALPNAMNTGKDLYMIPPFESFSANLSITCTHGE